MHGQQTKEMKKCIDDCLECFQICEETANHCLTMGGKHAEASHVRLLLDCATVCNASAALMSRGSQFSSDQCEVCAEICERCADDCEKMADDKEMKACADMCRRCAESCRQMAGANV